MSSTSPIATLDVSQLTMADCVRLGRYQRWLRGESFRIQYYSGVARFWRVTWWPQRRHFHAKPHEATFDSLSEAFDFCERYCLGNLR